jgi:hypothetical protein
MASAPILLDSERSSLGQAGPLSRNDGMRRSQTIVEEDGFRLRGLDGAHEFVSVACRD